MPDVSGSTTQQLQRLLDRFAAGDSAARDELIGRAYERLVVRTRKLLGSFARVRAKEETAGVLNEAYLKLRVALGEVMPGSVRQFMGLAALEIRRVLLDHVRKLDGRGQSPRPAKVSLDRVAGLDLAGSVSDQDRRALTLDLLEAMGRLPDEEREAVELLFFHGCTQPEAAELLGVHEDTVKRRWSRARVRLAEQLAPFNTGA